MDSNRVILSAKQKALRVNMNHDLYGTFGGSNRSSSFPGERSRGGSRGSGGGYSRAYTRQRSASASSAGSSYARSNSYGGGAYGSNRRSWSGYDYSYGF